MTTQPQASPRSINWGRSTRLPRIVAVMLVVVIILASMAPAASSILPDVMQPELVTLASDQPGGRLHIVVQKHVGDTRAEQLVSAMGGEITGEFDFINSFAAELPASALPELARLPDVRRISIDAPVQSTVCAMCIDTSKLLDSYIKTIGADRLWNETATNHLQGRGITVAVVDSGINPNSDLTIIENGVTRSRILSTTQQNSLNNYKPGDAYGHGTHVAGIIGGNGKSSQGTRMGVAPGVNLLNVHVADQNGKSRVSDVLNGLSWIFKNKDVYNIRVVNMSLNTTVSESYMTNILNAAVEFLWFNKIVVVVSAGNNGAGSTNDIMYPPANDPFVITVGSADDRGTPRTDDDDVAPYSAYGVTKEGHSKPDLVAPGQNIISLLSSPTSVLPTQYPKHNTSGFTGSKNYFRMSGTSMAAAVTSGAVALLLQDEPNLTPDQVKYRLKSTANPLNRPGTGSGLLNIYAAVHSNSVKSANTGIHVSKVLRHAFKISPTWDSASWNSASWNSASWNSASWNSASWNSASWNSTNHGTSIVSNGNWDE